MSAPTMVVKGREEPRIFTKPLRDLSDPKNTHGYAAIFFAETMLGMRLFPWQKWVLIHGLELRPDGRYRFRTVVILVGRQNGKTAIEIVLALWHIYALKSKTVIGTAQDLINAEKAWEEAVAMAEADPELAELIEAASKGHPKRLIVHHPNDPETGDEGPRCEYRVATASRRGARGNSGDLVLLDELREHQSWEAWAASTKTTLARPKAQVWCFSNAGDALSIVLRFLRAQAHQSLEWPDGDGDADILATADEDFAEWEDELDEGESLALFEYSAAPNAHRADREAWAQANPSMNHTDVVEDCITDRAIAAALKTDPAPVFEVEVLCRWLNTAGDGPFPDGAWAKTAAEAGASFSDESPRVLCLDMSWKRSKVYVARAGFTPEGVPLVDIAADRAGSDWVVPWLVKHRKRYSAVVIQSNGAPVTSLLDPIAAAVDENGYDAEIPVVEWSGADLGSGFGVLYDLLDGSTAGSVKVLHLPHPGLDRAAATAVPKVLGQGAVVIDRAKSPTDAAPLNAMLGALWGLLHGDSDAPQRSYYADNEVMVL